MNDCGNNGPCANPREYFTAKNDYLVCFKGYTSSQILDITYLDGVYYAIIKGDPHTILMKKGRKGKTTTVTSKTPAIRIIAFNGDLYILNTSGTLMARDPDCYNRRCWYWYAVQGMPTDIKWITTTLNQRNLWIQTVDEGFLYNCRRKVSEEITMPSTTIRVYGKKKSIYLEVDTLTNHMTVAGCVRVFTEAAIAVFDECTDIIYLRPDAKAYVTGMRALPCGGVYFLIV